MQNTKKTALLLVNVGTPDQPEVPAVRRYLTQFLNDKYVIDLPVLLRLFLVNVIIIPFRVRKSTALYKRLWTQQGSPLLIYLKSLVQKVQEKAATGTKVYGAMRYGNPSLKTVLNQIKEEQFDELVVLPLYPHYASSTSYTTINKVEHLIKKWSVQPQLKIIKQFYHHPAFLEAFTKRIADSQPGNYDHLVFSYHGLPERQVNAMHPGIACTECTCEKHLPEHGEFCYKATCYETSRLLAKKLGIEEKDYSVGFQSRLSKNWLSPFTDELLSNLAKEGKKKVLVAAPSFVADCLETIVEIGHEYKEEWNRSGGKELKLVESLNDWDVWVNAIIEIVKIED